MIPSGPAAGLMMLRTSRRLSQHELGRRAGVSQGMIAQIENGKRACSDRIAGRLAEALDVTVADLRTGHCGRCSGVPPAGFACLACGREGRP